MGLKWSSSTSPEKKATTESSQLIYLEEQEALVREWGSEGFCTYVSRFFGFEKDSKMAQRKETQRYVQFIPGRNDYMRGIDANSFAKLGLNPDVYDSIVRIQVFYRGYRTIQRFKSIVNECVMRIRTERRRLAEIQQDQEALTHFRELLARGFPALKLTSHGKWKTASFRLILKSNECYLTWEPSRKLHPRLNLHDIERVEPIRRGDHDEIASFISHRKCLLIFSKTLREGSMILQLSTARERELLLKGFESLIQQIKTSRSQLDESGVVRQQAHQKAVVFFQQGENPQEQERQNPLETLYHTRFDHDAIELQEETSEEHDLDELFNRKFKQIS